MDQDIKIMAWLQPSGSSCKFEVDRPIYPNGSIHFRSKEKAAGAPLVEKLFALENVHGVRISGSELLVAMEEGSDLKSVAKKIGEIIREQLSSKIAPIPADFKFPALPDSEIRVIVQEIIDMQINPSVASHGGMIHLLDVKDNKIYLKMGGGCQGCGMADMTLRQGIETAIRERLPDIQDILDATDHAGGTNPYYSK